VVGFLHDIMFRKSGKADKVEGGAGWVRREVYDGRPYHANLDRRAVAAWVKGGEVENLVQIDKPESIMTKEEKAKRAGKWVWVPSPTEVWQWAKVVSSNSDGSVTVQPEKGARR